MKIVQHKSSIDVPKFHIGADLMTYSSCNRKYHYYNVAGFPQSDKNYLWLSEFILAVEHEAYRLWDSGIKNTDPKTSNDINRTVSTYMTAQGMEKNDELFRQYDDTVPDKLMNKRS